MSKNRNRTTNTAPALPATVIGVQWNPDTGMVSAALPTTERRRYLAMIADLELQRDTLDAMRLLQSLLVQIDLIVVLANKGDLHNLLIKTDFAALLSLHWTKFRARAVQLIPNFETLYADDTRRVLERYDALLNRDFDRLLAVVGTEPGEMGALARAVVAKATQGRAADDVVTRWYEYAMQYHVQAAKPRPSWAKSDQNLRRDLEAHCNDDIDRAILRELQADQDGQRLKRRYHERNRKQRY